MENITTSTRQLPASNAACMTSAAVWQSQAPARIRVASVSHLPMGGYGMSGALGRTDGADFAVRTAKGSPPRGVPR